jgi:hypothetical protein
MKKKFKAIVYFSGLLVCAVMSLSAQDVHAQLRDAWSQTTTTIVYEDATGEIQDVRLGGNSGTPTPTPRGFWRTMASCATFGLLGSPASPVHTMRETAPDWLMRVYRQMMPTYRCQLDYFLFCSVEGN